MAATGQVKPGTTCRRPGCPGIVRDGVCNRCGPLRAAGDHTYNERRGKTAELGYGGAWRRLREVKLASNPLCRMCADREMVTPATDVDHIIPKRWGGEDALENLQSLCHRCHTQKTNRENKPWLWQGTTMAKVVVVAGPPGAGKTYYVKQHKGDNDLIVDLDALLAALTFKDWYTRTQPQLHMGLAVREFLLLRLLRPSDIDTAWVITSAADPDERAAIAQQCGAREIVVILAERDECMHHLRNDGRRNDQLQHWYAIVNTWWENYRQGARETILQLDGDSFRLATIGRPGV